MRVGEAPQTVGEVQAKKEKQRKSSGSVIEVGCFSALASFLHLLFSLSLPSDTLSSTISSSSALHRSTPATPVVRSSPAPYPSTPSVPHTPASAASTPRIGGVLNVDTLNLASSSGRSAQQGLTPLNLADTISQPTSLTSTICMTPTSKQLASMSQSITNYDEADRDSNTAANRTPRKYTQDGSVRMEILARHLACSFPGLMAPGRRLHSECWLAVCCVHSRSYVD